MAEKYRPSVGDWVRVTLEGRVRTADPMYTEIEGDDGVWAGEVRNFVPIEKIEPPVEVFKPGDVVRGRFSGTVYTLAENGAVDHRNGRFEPYEYDDRVFTSTLFERVNLS